MIAVFLAGGVLVLLAAESVAPETGSEEDEEDAGHEWDANRGKYDADQHPSGQDGAVLYHTLELVT